MNERTILEAVRDGLTEEMRRDPLVWAVGEDLHIGGLYGQYKGLIEEFGPGRIVASPISEAMIVSAGLGGALVGTRPVVEMRIADFALPAIDEIVNQTAKARFMFGGQARVPVVMRLPQGLMASSAAQHSQSLESWYVHVPGLVVLAPSTPADCKGLLKSAIRCDDPVIFIEPRANWQMRGAVPEDTEHLVPIGRARIARAGNNLTVVSWSAMTPVAMKAAEFSVGKRTGRRGHRSAFALALGYGDGFCIGRANRSVAGRPRGRPGLRAWGRDRGECGRIHWADAALPAPTARRTAGPGRLLAAAGSGLSRDGREDQCCDA